MSLIFSLLLKLLKMFKFQKYKLYLFSGRVVGGIEGGLISVLFVSWIIPVIGQNGFALCDVLCTIAGAILAAVFALDPVIKFSIDRPYLLLYSMIFGMILDAGFMLIPGINPWVILFTGCIGCCVLGQGFFYARQAMINRKISGDSLTKLNNSLQTTGMISAIIGASSSVLIEPSLVSMATVTLCSVVLSFPLCFMQIFELQKLPDVPKS